MLASRVGKATSIICFEPEEKYSQSFNRVRGNTLEPQLKKLFVLIALSTITMASCHFVLIAD